MALNECIMGIKQGNWALLQIGKLKGEIMSYTRVKNYYALFVFSEDLNGFDFEFGDFDREVVESEQDDFLDKGVLKKNCKILKMYNDLSDLSETIKELNK